MATRAGRERAQNTKKAEPMKSEASRETNMETTAGMMPKTEDDLWWLGLLQGIAAIFFGIVAIFWPGLTLVTLVYLFSAFILAWGVVEVIHGFLSVRRRDTWWLTLLFGLIALGVGIYLVRHPRVSFTALILIIGLVLIGRGLLDFAAASMARRGATHRALTFIVGAAALIAGIILLFQPEAGGVAFVWILGLYALVFGALTTALAIETRDMIRSHHDDYDYYHHRDPDRRR